MLSDKSEKSPLPAFTENHLLSFQVVFSSKSHDGVINPDNPQENQWHRGIFNMDFKSKKYLISENERIVLMQAFKELQNIMISKDESLHFVTLTFGNDEWEIIPQNVAEAACIEHLMQCMSAGKASKVSEVVKSGLNKGIIGLDHIHIMKYGLVHQYDNQGNKQQMRFFVLIPGKLFGFQQEKKKLGYPATLVTSLLNAKVVTVPEAAGFQLHVDASDPIFLDAVQEVDRPSWIKEINASIEFTKGSVEGIIVKNAEPGDVKQQDKSKSKDKSKDKSKAENSGNEAPPITSTSKTPREQPPAQPRREQPSEQPKQEQIPAQTQKEKPPEQPKPAPPPPPPAQPKKEPPPVPPAPPAQPKKEQPSEQPMKEQPPVPPSQPRKERPYEAARKDHSPKHEAKPEQTKQENTAGPSTQGQNRNDYQVFEEDVVQPIAQSIMECDDGSDNDIESYNASNRRNRHNRHNPLNRHNPHNPHNPYDPLRQSKQKNPKSEARVVLEVSLSELDNMLGQIKNTNVLSELHRFTISNCGDMQRIASMSPKHWSAVNEISKALNGMWTTSTVPGRQDLVIASKPFPNSQAKPESSRWSPNSRACIDKLTGHSLQASESTLSPFPLLQGTDTSMSVYNPRRGGQRAGKEPVTTLSGMSKPESSYMARNRSQGAENFSSMVQLEDMSLNARQVFPNQGIMQENPLYDQHQLTSYNQCRESPNRITSDPIRNMRLCHNEVFDPTGDGNSGDDVESIMSDEPESVYTDRDTSPIDTARKGANYDGRGLSNISPRNNNAVSNISPRNSNAMLNISPRNNNAMLNISPRSSISHRDLLFQCNPEIIDGGRSNLPVQKSGTELNSQSSRLARIRHKMQEFVTSETDQTHMGQFPQSRTLAEYRKTQNKEKRSTSRSKSRFCTNYASDFERKPGGQSSRRNSKICPESDLAASTHHEMISPIQMGNGPISSMQMGDAQISPRPIKNETISQVQLGNVPVSRSNSLQSLGAAIMSTPKSGLRNPADECSGILSRANESYIFRNPVEECIGMSRFNDIDTTTSSTYPATRPMQRFDTINPGNQTSHINSRSEESAEPVVSLFSQPSADENRNTNHVMSNPTGYHPLEGSRAKAPMGSYKTSQYNQATGNGVQQNGNLRSNAAPVMSNYPHASNIPQPANLQRDPCSQTLGQDGNGVQQNGNLRSNAAPVMSNYPHASNIPQPANLQRDPCSQALGQDGNGVQQNGNLRSNAAPVMSNYPHAFNIPQPANLQRDPGSQALGQDGNGVQQNSNLRSNAAPVMSNYPHTSNIPQPANLQRDPGSQALGQDVKPSPLVQQNRILRPNNAPGIPSNQYVVNVPVQGNHYNQAQQNRNTRSHDPSVMPIYQINSNMTESNFCQQYNQELQSTSLKNNQYNQAMIQEAQPNNLPGNQYNQAMLQEVRSSQMNQPSQRRRSRSNNVPVMNSYQRGSNVPEPLIYSRPVSGISMDKEFDDDEMNYHSQGFQSADF